MFFLTALDIFLESGLRGHGLLQFYRQDDLPPRERRRNASFPMNAARPLSLGNVQE
jgi:hypothetical protein